MATDVTSLSIGRMLITPEPHDARTPEIYRRRRELGLTDNEPDQTLLATLVLNIDDPLQKADLNQAKNVIVNFNCLASRTHAAYYSHLQHLGRAGSCYAGGKLAWPLAIVFPDRTDFTPLENVRKIDDETAQFIVDNDLQSGVRWLLTMAPDLFEGADFELRVLPAEDGERQLLAFKVYGIFEASEFRELRHRLCREMVEARHTNLYECVSIFQRRVPDSGWKAISYYRSLSAE